MTYQSKIKQKLAFMAFMVLLCITGCHHDSYVEDNQSITGNSSGYDMLITVNIPGQETPLNRSIANGKGEAAVENATILVFKDGDHDNTEILAEFVKGEIVSKSVKSDDGYKVTLKAKLTPCASAKSVAILANVPESTITAAVNNGKSKQEILSLLTFSLQGKWKTNPNDFTPIPMFGEMPIEKGGITNGMKIENMNLIRMLARIDIVNKANGFTLSDVYVVNYNNTGYIAPSWDTNSGKLLHPQYETAPMIPSANISQIGTGDALRYSYTGAGLQGEIYLFEALKAAGNVGNVLRDNAMCLIVKGKRDGDTSDHYYRIDFTTGKDEAGKTPGAPGFSPATVDYMHVYRNHLYSFELSEVKGPGYGSLDQAYKSSGIMNNLKTHLHVIDLNDIKDIVFNGEHYLGVGDFSAFKQKGGNANVLVSTNYTYGWTVKKITYPGNDTGWLTAVKENTNDSKNCNLQLTAMANYGNEERNASVILSAGRLVYELEIIQGYEQLMVRIYEYANGQKGKEISSLDFIANGSQQVDAQSFIVEWLPKEKPLKIVTVTDNGYQSDFVYNAGSDKVLTETFSDASGTRVYTIQPGALASQKTFYEQGFAAMFSISDEDETKMAKLDVRHYNRNAAIEKKDIYLLDGSANHSFTVKSNVEWKAYFVRQNVTSGSNKQFITRMGGNYVSMNHSASPILVGSGSHNLENGGTRIEFSVINEINRQPEPELYLGEGYIFVVSDNDESNPKYFEDINDTLFCASALRVGESNSYMIHNNALLPILIPVSQLQYAIGSKVMPDNGFLSSTWISEAINLNAQVFWSDIALSGDNPVVKSVKFIGSKPYNLKEMWIMVIPGRGKGNAGIFLFDDKNGNGSFDAGENIRWSWHIWNSEYYPYNADGSPNGKKTGNQSLNNENWMDRDLGAMSNIPGDSRTSGFFYQWGRKDPIQNNNNAFNYIANVNFLRSAAPTGPNIQLTVSNPSTIYTNSLYPPYDWNRGASNDNLWGGGSETEFLHPAVNGVRKSVYDPCPEGYRLPRNGEWVNDGSWLKPGNGLINNNFGGFYPVTGRYSSSGSFDSGSIIFGYHWSATPNMKEYPNRGYFLSFNKSGQMNVSGSEFRSISYGVRCRAQ